MSLAKSKSSVTKFKPEIGTAQPQLVLLLLLERIILIQATDNKEAGHYLLGNWVIDTNHPLTPTLEKLLLHTERQQNRTSWG